MLQGENRYIFYLFHKDIYSLWPNVTHIYKLNKIAYDLPAMHIGIEKPVIIS